jgi:uncharacterized membrane protein YfcA
MADPLTPALLFLAGCVSWTISTFSGGAGGVILLATVTHLIRVTQVAPVVTVASLMASPRSHRPLMAAGGMAGGAMVSAWRRHGGDAGRLALELGAGRLAHPPCRGVPRRQRVAISVHSLFIQITKIVTYASVGTLSSRSLLEGVAAGLGAVLAIFVTRQWLNILRDGWFRRFAIVLMLTSGSSMLWQSRHLVF